MKGYPCDTAQRQLWIKRHRFKYQTESRAELDEKLHLVGRSNKVRWRQTNLCLGKLSQNFVIAQWVMSPCEKDAQTVFDMILGNTLKHGKRIISAQANHDLLGAYSLHE